MKILVCVKQVPRLDQVRFAPGLNRIVRDGVASTTNPLDRQALGHALALRDRHGGEVVVVTMGPPGARDVLVDALRAGADRAVHLVDPCFAGADTLATARALARVQQRERADLVLLGRGTVDGGTAQVGPQVAEFAGLPQITHAVDLAVTGDRLTALRATEQATERWTVTLPAVVSVERGPEPRTDDPTGPDAPDRPVAGAVVELDADLLGGDAAGYGIRGSATYVQRVDDSTVDRVGERLDDAATGAARIAALAAGARARTGVPAPAPLPARAADGARQVWVVAEDYREGLHPVSLEGLAAAHAVAGRLAAAVTAVLLVEPSGPADPADPAEPARLAAELLAHGADRVLVARLGTPAGTAGAAPEPRASALARLVARRAPLAVLGPWTVRGRDYLPRVAARLGVGMTGDVVGLDTTPHPGDDSVLDLVWLKPAWAGTALARVVARTVPSMGTLRPGSVPALPRRAAPGGAGLVESLDLTADSVPPGAPVPAGPAALPPTATLVGVRAGGAGLVEAAQVLLCLGGGAGPEVATLARRLAERSGWALVGTRAAVDRGLVPVDHQLSADRRSLSPPLVVAVDVVDPAELDPVRGAGTLVAVGGPGGDRSPLPADRVDLAVRAPSAAVLRSLADRVSAAAAVTSA